MSNDLIVTCDTLAAGDVVRRPVPNAEWLDVLNVNRDARELHVRSHADDTQFTMNWDSRAKWIVRRARGS